MASVAFRAFRGGHVESNNNRDLNSRKCERMFPDVDAEVIKAILRSNNGAVDATIHKLWAMSAENEYDKLLHDPTDGSISRTDKEHHHPDCSGNPASYQQETKGILT
jgi:hypothetical protein